MSTRRRFVKCQASPGIKKYFSGITVCLWIAACSSGYAAESEGNPVRVVVGGGVVHDSNLFRLPDFINPQTALGNSKKSDTVANAYVGLRVDQPYSLQRFQLDFTETAYRYENFSHLNYNAFDYRAAWLWHLTPALSGTLSAEQKETLVPFEDFVILSQQRNVRDNDSADFQLDWRLGGEVHLLGGVSHFRQRSEVPLLAEADFNLVDVQGGVRYEFSEANSLAFVQHFRDGEYLNRPANLLAQLDSSFKETESEFRLKWVPAGHSTMGARMGWLDRRHDNFPARDFSGVVGELGYGWTPPGKMKFYFSVKRSIDALSDPFSSYRINNTYSIVPSWRATDRITLSFRLDRIDSDFRGPVVPSPLPARSDTLNSVKLMIDWAPTRNILLSTGVQQAERSSNAALAEFDTSIFLLRANLKF